MLDTIYWTIRDAHTLLFGTESSHSTIHMDDDPKNDFVNTSEGHGEYLIV